ncbi:hypothetical protein AOXY_G8440 [Acipenser oxyrinchus oxyrinchus]|uniref:Uncharacterized protein n=1 Tax=Acipenser oxyrinchus oxyrinchus TaxID=40147 RepID=A0AAD8G808_ACIOX|nr:hypothetical protein AOXY_G8440 [Acipenser oxyrinchus oxyrinchus]
MFALFDFFEEKSVVVGDLNCIDASCGVSLDELYPDQWDFSRDIIVKWPTKSNKKGKGTTSNKLYPAQILEISDNEQLLNQKRDSLVAGKDIESESGMRSRNEEEEDCTILF